MNTTPEFVRQGIAFTTTEHRIEMAKQAAAALEIATVWNALQSDEEWTKWDLELMTKTANMSRYAG